MKKLILLALVTISFSSFAQTMANFKERSLLCTSVDMLLASEQADLALDVPACLRTITVASAQMPNGINKVKGYLDFNAPGRPTFKLVCELSYKGSPELHNIIDGIENGVICLNDF